MQGAASDISLLFFFNVFYHEVCEASTRTGEKGKKGTVCNRFRRGIAKILHITFSAQWLKNHGRVSKHNLHVYMMDILLSVLFLRFNDVLS